MAKLFSIMLLILVYIQAFAVYVAHSAHATLRNFMHSRGMILTVSDFSKEERVAFEDILEGFNDALVLSKAVNTYTPDQTTMERTNDVIWRPMPYISTSYDGQDATANWGGATQLSVPATIGYEKHVPLILTANELRDALQENRLGDSAKQKLASDINVALMNVAALQGTLFVKRSAAAAGYDDVAQCEAIMNELGVAADARYLALSTRDYNGMASNLAVATRSFGNAKSENAYERSKVGVVASFDTYKLDYAIRKAAAAGGAGITMSTLDAGANYYTPVGSRVSATGERSNVDNRYQTITVSSTASVVAGDAFTVADLNAVHLITKQDTGQLKTFRVISVDSDTTMTISPPMITNQGGTEAEARYKNCVINTKAANSALVFLNTVAAAVNPFWHRDAMEIIPGRYVLPAGAGVALMRGTTDQGIELTMQKFYDINTMKTKLRWDTRFGVVMEQPEMAGLMMFSQT